MNLHPLKELAFEQVATLTDPASAELWTFQRHATGFVMTSPAFEYDAHDSLSFVLGCLLENGSGNLPESARFVAVGQQTVHLEWVCTSEQLELAWQEAHTAFAQIQSGLTQGQRQDDHRATSESEAELGLTPDQSALFGLLNALVAQSSELMAVYEYQPEQGLAILESDDGDWLACVRPSAYPDQLSFLFPLAVVEEYAHQAAWQCMQLLQWNSVISLGPEVSIACLSDGQTLVLKAELNPHQADVQDVLALLGKLTVMVEELQQWLEEAQERPALPQSVQGPEGSMMLMMSGMLA